MEVWDWKRKLLDSVGWLPLVIGAGMIHYGTFSLAKRLLTSRLVASVI